MVLSAAPAMSGGGVEAVALGGGDAALRAELGAERGEDRVARLGEGDDERAAAVLAVGVFQVHALQDRLLLHRVGLLRVRDPRLERARRRDHLERGAGRLQAREGDPGEGEHLSGARLERHDAAQARAERGHRRLLDGQGDRRAHGRRLARAGALEYPRPRHELASRRPQQALVEDPLEARDADLGVGGHPERGELGAALGRDRAELADDLRRQQRGRGAVVALGQHGAVAGQQRGARGHPRDARRRWPAPSPGKTSARDQSMPSLVAGRTTSPVTVPNARVGCAPHAVGAAVLARPGRIDLGRRRGLHRVEVGGGEARPGNAIAIVGGQLGVHRRVIAALPRGREAFHMRLAGRLVAGADHEADDEGDSAHRQHRDQALL